MPVRSLGQEDPLEKEMATCSSVLTWKIPWTEESEGLQSVGLKRVGHDWVTEHELYPSVCTFCLLNLVLCISVFSARLKLPIMSFLMYFRRAVLRVNSWQNQHLSSLDACSWPKLIKSFQQPFGSLWGCQLLGTWIFCECTLNNCVTLHGCLLSEAKIVFQWWLRCFAQII